MVASQPQQAGVCLEAALGSGALASRLRKEGSLLPSGLLSVADFLNHRADAVLLDSCGALLAGPLGKDAPTKVLTGASLQGMLPAQCVAKHLRVPLVFARTSVPEAWKGTSSHSVTCKGSTFWVCGELLKADDRVVIVDDIMASGATIAALKAVCEKACAAVVGIGVLIDKRQKTDAASEPHPNFVSVVQVSSAANGKESFSVVAPIDNVRVPPCVASDALSNRIREEGKVLPGNLLKVYSFVNHQVDTRMMDMCGELVARVFAPFGVDKVLTAATGGLPPAHAVATALKVPLVCAREVPSREHLSVDSVYTADSESFTKKKTLVLYVDRDFLHEGERVLVVDDFLATGTTAVALHKLCEQAKSKVAGMTFLVEKRFQKGREHILSKLPHMDGHVMSLASILRMSEAEIVLDQDVVGRCAPVPQPPADVMIERVVQAAKPAAEGQINASNFINHMVDASLIDQCGFLIARRFADERINLVLAAQTAGVCPALSASFHLRVPLLCARKDVSEVMKGGEVLSATAQGLHVLAGHLRKGDNVLIVGDFLASGSSALALYDLCQQAGAGVIGMAFLVEKAFENGRTNILAKVPQLSEDIFSLTNVLGAETEALRVFRCPEKAQHMWTRVATGLAKRMRAEMTFDPVSHALKFKSILSFHNSMDPVLLDACGEVLAAQFAGVTKVLTGAPIQGLAVAHVISRHLGVPMIFSRTAVPLTMKGQKILSAPLADKTLNVSAEFLGPKDNVLIADDIIASGRSVLALQQICEAAGASVAGFAFLAQNQTPLRGVREQEEMSGPARIAAVDRSQLKGKGIVSLVSMRGGNTAAECTVELSDWLRQSSNKKPRLV
eukprot:TRINITY_DN111384_c0_g1_i1.p1 TRINITY_DN111384_c0_g1~~TRINITY_DN111384_c0_g1_i1.p1  ORF type:complete len:844 (-),score=219.69 TRINITY_DN111384_c0_g1_i1:289-2820(-)